MALQNLKSKNLADGKWQVGWFDTGIYRAVQQQSEQVKEQCLRCTDINALYPRWLLKPVGSTKMSTAKHLCYVQLSVTQ